MENIGGFMLDKIEISFDLEAFTSEEAEKAYDNMKGFYAMYNHNEKIYFHYNTVYKIISYLIHKFKDMPKELKFIKGISIEQKSLEKRGAWLYTKDIVRLLKLYEQKPPKQELPNPNLNRKMMEAIRKACNE
jgi:predicted HAD superfamily hydrolase